MAAFVCKMKGYMVYKQSDISTRALITQFAFMGIKDYIEKTRLKIDQKIVISLFLKYLNRNVYTKNFQNNSIVFWKEEPILILGEYFRPLQERAMRLLN